MNVRLLVTVAAGVFFGLPSASSAAVVGHDINYESDGESLQGYLAYDEAIVGERPGVLVVHEWWGQNEYARERARMLAKLGYTALALDMYGQGKTADHPKEAGEFSKQALADAERAKARFVAAKKLLEEHDTVDASRIGAIGYCFGGGVVLRMAMRGVELDGVVSFHGSLPTDIRPESGSVKAKILICHGSEDKFVDEEKITQFKDALRAAGADFRFVSYDGAKHSFTNPQADEMAKKFDIPIGYSETADKKSWKDMERFFEEIFSHKQMEGS